MDLKWAHQSTGHIAELFHIQNQENETNNGERRGGHYGKIMEKMCTSFYSFTEENSKASRKLSVNTTKSPYKQAYHLSK